MHETRPGFVRLTAADWPGVAQPVPERDIPAQPWGRIWIGALLLALALLAWWEMHWRAFGATPSYRNSDGQWAVERRRVGTADAETVVLVGDSRLLFDVQLDSWERATGKRPIQLAMEGTSPLPVLEDLAADPSFTGRVLVDVAPRVFFGNSSRRANVADYARRQGPSQRSGTWLSMHLLEPYFTFLEPDFALAVVMQRQPIWPKRPGLRMRTPVRKLADHEVDRNTYMWHKLVDDPAYRELARSIWAEEFDRPLRGMDTPEATRAAVDAQIERTAKAVATLRARGVRLVFVRPPSIGPYLEWEEKYLPRAATWDPLVARLGVPAIHFADHPQLQGYDQPEWSHLSRSEAERFTEQLAPLVIAEFEKLEANP